MKGKYIRQHLFIYKEKKHMHVQTKKGRIACTRQVDESNKAEVKRLKSKKDYRHIGCFDVWYADTGINRLGLGYGQHGEFSKEGSF